MLFQNFHQADKLVGSSDLLEMVFVLEAMLIKLCS